jgi:ferric-dicitrate binding protein FerR (iron transport regulator)
VQSLDDLRRTQAAAWFLARRGPMTVERRQDFERWHADPSNQAALRAMEAGWQAAEGARDWFPRPAVVAPDRRRFLVRGGDLVDRKPRYELAGRGADRHR